MSCNNNEYCKSIAANYTKKKYDLNGDFNYLKKELKDIEEELAKQVIPDDYLGRKVTEKLEKLELDNKENVELFFETERSITHFAEVKAEEHMDHYNNWLNQQKEKEKENDEASE